MRRAVHDMIRWWLDKGIDGFRLDAISHIKKEAGFEDIIPPRGKEHLPYQIVGENRITSYNVCYTKLLRA